MRQKEYFSAGVNSTLIAMEIICDKEDLIAALKKGEYVIGADIGSSVVMQNVFHYSNGMVEFFRFKDVTQNIMPPMKLVRDICIWDPTDDLSLFFAGLQYYDIFLVCRCNNFFDI